MGVATSEQWKCTDTVGKGGRERCSLGHFQHKDRFSCKELRQSHRAGPELKCRAGSLSKLLGPITPLPGGNWI